MSESGSKIVPPDGGYGWVVVAIAFIGNYVLDGIQFSFGILLEELHGAFNVDYMAVVMVGSTLSCLYLGLGAVAGALLMVYGCRPLFAFGSVLSTFGFFLGTFAPNVYVLILCYGVLGGMGFSLVYMAGIVVVSQYFVERRSLANGIARSGTSIGSTMMSGLGNLIIHRYGWKVLLLTFAGHCLTCFVISVGLKPLSNDTSSNKKFRDVIVMMFGKQFLADNVFQMKLVSQCSMVMGFGIPYAYLVSMVTHFLGSDLNPDHAGLPMVALGLANGFGRVVFGLLGDRVSPQFILSVTLLGSMVGVLSLVFCSNLTAFILCSAFYGFFIGPTISMTSEVLIEIYGNESLPLTMGLWNFAEGLSAIPGNLIGGLLFKVTQRYENVFYFAAGLFGVALFFNHVSYWVYLRRKRQ